MSVYRALHNLKLANSFIPISDQRVASTNHIFCHYFLSHAGCCQFPPQDRVTQKVQLIIFISGRSKTLAQVVQNIKL